jgi:hypothetical protein
MVLSLSSEGEFTLQNTPTARWAQITSAIVTIAKIRSARASRTLAAFNAVAIPTTVRAMIAAAAPKSSSPSSSAQDGTNGSKKSSRSQGKLPQLTGSIYAEPIQRLAS